MTTRLTPRARFLVSTGILAFIAGAFAGVAADRVIGGPPALRIQAGPTDLSHLLDELRLTPAQRTQADSIAVGTAPRSRAIMMDAARRLMVVADSVDRELRAILTPEQRARLDSLRQEPRFLLMRKTVVPGATRVDTVFDGRP
jgi:Spy/CpxP family protein refolding chaperone